MFVSLYRDKMLRGRTIFYVENILSKRYINCKKGLVTSSTSANSSEKSKVVEGRQDGISNETRKFKNKSFLKNVFAGVYEPESLIFPESLSKEELQTLNDQVVKVKDFFKQKGNKKIIYDQALFKELKEIGLVGNAVDLDFGGSNFKATRVLRLFEEISDEGIASILYSHNNLAIKCLDQFGSMELKEKYLPVLTSGESYVVPCITEAASGSDMSMAKCRAVLSDDKTFYTLSGEKTWVINADKADHFIVFAKTQNSAGMDEDDRVDAFIVEKNHRGITMTNPYNTIDLKDLPVFTVKFSGTRVPVSNLIGAPGAGFQIATSMLYGDLFMKGGMWAGILKNLSKKLVDHCIKRKVFGSALKDFGMIQEKLVKMAMNIYAIESMSYMTAGVVDSHVQPDVFCESAAIKIFASESLWESVKDAMQIIGSEACMLENPVPNILMNASTYSLILSTNEILRLFIALNCMQHSAMKCKEDVRKRRDAFNNVGYLLKQGWLNLKSKETLDLKLYDHVHPRLCTCGEELEFRVYRLKHLAIKVWSSSFLRFQENQYILKKFADIAINLYVTNACLARATRSKAIGLKNCDEEITIASLICDEKLRKIDQDIETVNSAFHGGGDRLSMKFSESMMNNRGYQLEHPLTRNW